MLSLLSKCTQMFTYPSKVAAPKIHGQYLNYPKSCCITDRKQMRPLITQTQVLHK